MVNRYNTGEENTYRVVGFPFAHIVAERQGKPGYPNPEMDVLEGPYVMPGIAKGQCTKHRKQQAYRLEKYGHPPVYERIVVQMSPSVWTELEH